MRITMTGSARPGRGVGGKIIFSLFGLVFAGFGLLAVRGALEDANEAQAMRSWPSAPCVITICQMEDHGEDFRLRLEYTYPVAGQQHTASRYGLTAGYTAQAIGPIKAAEKRYAQGTQTTCHYNPARPGDAVLVLPAVGEARKAVAFTLIFPAFGLFFALLPWWLKGNERQGAGQSNTSKSPKLFLIIFGLIFAGAGAAMIKPLLITPLQKSVAAKSWNAVTATVVSSKVKSHDSDDGTTYSPYIAYRYEVGGGEYFGH